MKQNYFLRMAFFALLFFLLNWKAVAQTSPGCSNPGCTTSTLNISTGVDPNTGLLLPINTAPKQAIDQQWQIVSVPGGSGVVPPSPSWVINPFSSWANFPAARWLSPFVSSEYNENSPASFVFRNCFCVCQATTVNINLQLLADDQADIYIDGILLATGVPYQFQWANRRIVNSTQTLTAGTHCLEVRLRNTNSVAMGFAVQGTVNGANLISSVCCNPSGSICGTKYRDMNCDGTITDNDPVVDSGVTIELRDSGGNIIATTTTDGVGSYCFTGLTPGAYQVSEVVASGWSQTFPAGGTHTVNVSAGLTNTVNFANCEVPGDICGIKFDDHNCNGVQDPGDNGLSGVTINLFAATDIYNQFPIATTISAADGSYCFNNLQPIGYTVREDVPLGWMQTYPLNGAPHSVTVQSGATSTANFGNCIPPTGGGGCEMELKFEAGIDGCKVEFKPDLSNIPSGYILAGTSWTFGDGYSSDQLSPIHFFNNTGTFQVCLTVTLYSEEEKRCCTKFICQEIVIENCYSEDCKLEAKPDFTLDEKTCTYTFSTNLISTSTPVNLIFWDFGDGTTANGASVQHQFPGPGDYKVCVRLFGKVLEGQECCFETYCFEVRVECDPSKLERKVNTAPNNTIEFGQLDPKGMDLFPNPNGGSFHLTTKLDNDAKVVLRIMDVKGSQVFIQDLGNIASGKRSFLINANLPSGAYICEVTSGNQIQRSQLLIE